jgi:hypothetical protein
MNYYNPSLSSTNLPGLMAERDSGLNHFIKKLCDTVQKDRYMFFADGVPHVACPSWVRDHIHEMKAYRHWETDMKSFIDFLIRHQTPEGFFYEIVADITNSHASFVNPDCVFYDQANNLVFIRLECEADVEYLIVEGAVRIYKTTGDEEWIRRVLPALEKSIDYCMTNPKRYNSEYGLVYRTFTIDTWDFTAGYTDSNRRIEEGMPLSIMHGDNTGVYQAMKQLEWLNRHFGNESAAIRWNVRAETLKTNINRYLWNGCFFTHQLHVNHDGIYGVDETGVLSLSNTYDMNRGFCTQEQINSIIAEYQKRRGTAGTFAEWFSIDPPYPGFGGPNNNLYPAEKYINGGIASFTAGELARAALEHGHEKYGWDIIQRLRELVAKDGNLYFLYNPKTGENLGGGPSGWGAAAILEAIDEGLAGIEDAGVCYDHLRFSPRWAVTGLKTVKYVTGYEASKTLVESIYLEEEDAVTLYLGCPSEKVDCHILLPDDAYAREVILDGEAIDFTTEDVNGSLYINFEFNKAARERSFCEWLPHEKNQIIIKL